MLKLLIILYQMVLLYQYVVMLRMKTCIALYTQIGRARYRAPELLFQPYLIGEESKGIHEVSNIMIEV